MNQDIMSLLWFTTNVKWGNCNELQLLVNHRTLDSDICHNPTSNTFYLVVVSFKYFLEIIKIILAAVHNIQSKSTICW